MTLLCHSLPEIPSEQWLALAGGLDQGRSWLHHPERHEALPRDRDGDRADAWVAAGEDLEAAGYAVADRGRAHRVDRAAAVAALADRVEDDARGLACVGRIQFD